MKFLIYFTALLLLMFAVDSKASQLQYLSCKNITAIESCSRNCFTVTEKISIDFIINKEKNIVMRKTFVDGDFKTSLTLQNCRIFDEKNWDCSESQSYSNAEIVKTEKMTNGIYATAIQNLRNSFFTGGCAR
jgi:hypothetical protein